MISTLPIIELLIILGVIALYTLLIMLIWNKVIIKKFPQSNIQTLTFWDALALSVFVSILSGSGIIYALNMRDHIVGE